MNKAHAARPFASVTLALALLLAAAAPLAAQVRPRPSRPTGAGGPRQPLRVPEPGIQERSFILHQIEKEANRPPEAKAAALALAQISDDFRRIQVINNQMMAAVMPAPAPDYKLVAETTGEVRKRAERLRQNLALPKNGGADATRVEYRTAADAAQLKSALLLLDRALMSFVKSPVFQNVGVLEAEAAARASRDLEAVIDLSRRIARDAAQLWKAAGPR